MLDEARIRFCDWDESGGSLEYDISNLHPDWDVLIQAYEVRGVSYEEQLIYTSDFTLFRRGSAVPEDFCTYPAAYKPPLWQVIFAIKQRFLNEVQPAIVEHFIKAPYRVAQRLTLYQKHLDLRAYDVEQTSHTFTFIRRAV
ncbi:hypothetical protein [Hymenobacter rubripertinctus]|uniref:Uncharacterized protein n=1 Tax=Hymenobacter rubripertinctus TaxID=2029981 RepID=A0A418R918_9BACT|nr:hypothetical protein [Hymenobacter rubripertinctus]RIY13906.1 hypothetical protein D0T11_02155 [Hymenobacter rubripertinctus]